MKNHIYYKNRPISSLESLAKALRVPLQQLKWAERNAEKLYRPGPSKEKSDGTIRETFDACAPLKTIQGQINKKILREVHYPPYLQGGIKDRNAPRDYVRNASLHSDTKILVNEDISNFFPSTKAAQINQVWRVLFKFSPIVADCLTSLTTYRGHLPQGAKTSSYLANLVFWDIEPEIFVEMNNAGLNYSRYIDDITISSKSIVSLTIKQFAIGQIRKMCTRRGYKLKKSKHRIETSGHKMNVNNLVVNKQAALSREDKARVRAAIHELKLLSECQPNTDDYAGKYHSVYGKVSNLTRLHPKLGQKYLSILDSLKLGNVSCEL